MASISYGMFGLSNLPVFLFKHRGIMSRKGWIYGALLVVDASGAFFILYSLRLTSVTSWTLISPISMVAVIPFSILLYGASYSWKHYSAVVLAITGLATLVFSDAKGDGSTSHSVHSVLLGDFFAVLGYFLYACSSTISEFVLRSGTPQSEVNSIVGLSGLVGGLLLATCLREIKKGVFDDPIVTVYIFGVGFANFLCYIFSVETLRTAGVVVQEVSLLGSNAWSSLAKIFILGGFHPNPIIFSLAVLLMVTGVVTFALSGDPYKKKRFHESLVEADTPETPQTDVQEPFLRHN